MKKTNNPYVILFNFASRSRPEKFLVGLDNIINNLSNKVDFKIVMSADIDDETMYGNSSFLDRLIPYVEKGHVIPFFGYSKNKIDAINRDINDLDFDWDILVNFSDDMRFNIFGFDDIIRSKFSAHFPDTNGNIYFNDGYVGDKISTMSIIGRAYYDQFKYIYEPSYKSLWCDNEYTEVAIKKNKIQYFNENLYTHLHPINTGGNIDEQLLKTESHNHEDYQNYLRRKSLNFDLT